MQWYNEDVRLATFIMHTFPFITLIDHTHSTAGNACKNFKVNLRNNSVSLYYLTCTCMGESDVSGHMFSVAHACTDRIMQLICMRQASVVCLGLFPT